MSGVVMYEEVREKNREPSSGPAIPTAELQPHTKEQKLVIAIFLFHPYFEMPG